MSRLSRAEVATIYTSYGHLLLRRCRVRMRDEAAAQDLLQEVFVKIMKYGGAFEAAESKLRWLYQVVDNCAFDAFDAGKRDRQQASAALAIEREAVDEAPRLLARLEASSALQALPPRERDLAVLAFVDGRSQGQIANELGWSRQTVNKKLQAIREKLTRWLRGN